MLCPDVHVHADGSGDFAGAPCRALLFAVVLILLLTLALPACGAKKEVRPGPALITPSKVTTEIQTLAVKVSAAAATVKSAPDKKTKAKTAPEKAGRTAQPTAVTPLRQLFGSADRNPDAVQPESGFFIGVPDVIHDGEPFVVEFKAEGANALTLNWGGKSLVVKPKSDEPGLFKALLPVPLDEKSKTLPLVMTISWSGSEEVFSANLPVKKRKYAVQRLNVDSKYVAPPAEVQEKIKRDRAEMRAAINLVSPYRYWNLPLKRAVPGEVTSLYGMRRVFNGKPKNPHKGVDYDARQGDPVAAVEAGRVVLVSEHYYGGNTVVIDHGLGVLSAYLHLSDFDVAVGQSVARGDNIGFIGSTGRVTGPHLHLSLYVLGESVNAAMCTDN